MKFRATVTFIDVTRMKDIQDKMHSALNYAENIIDTVREPLIVLDQKLVVISANKSFYETFKLQKSLTEGLRLYKIADGEWDIPPVRKLLEEIIKNDREMNDIELEHHFNQIGHKNMFLNARRIYRGDVGTEMILRTIRMQK